MKPTEPLHPGRYIPAAMAEPRSGVPRGPAGAGVEPGRGFPNPFVGRRRAGAAARRFHATRLTDDRPEAGGIRSLCRRADAHLYRKAAA